MPLPGYGSTSCLLLNITSVVPKCDETCVLDVGAHPFVTGRSFVGYRWAKVERAAELERRVADGVYRQHQPADIALVKRMVACMEDSPRTSGEMRKIAKIVWASLAST